MPGVFAIVDKTDRSDTATLLDHMLRRVKHHPWYGVEKHVDAASGVRAARVSLGLTNVARQPVRGPDGSFVFMDGELYDYGQQRAALEAAGFHFFGTSHAEALLHGYRHRGRDFFSTLNGKFAAVLWDARSNRLIAVNDRFGMKPLYYAKLPGRLLVASEIKAILVDADVSRAPNLRGLAQFFTFGQYFGEDTSLEAVRVLPPAGWLEFDVADDRLAVDRYWRFHPPRVNGSTQSELLDHLDEAFKRAVDSRVTGTSRLGLSLSGGLDARTILGAVDHDRAPLTTVAMGIEGSSDHRSASQLARLVNCRHHNYVLDDSFLGDFETHLCRMVNLTDGQYLSQCVVMPTLPFYRELGIEVLLRGHAGELMHMTKAYNFSLDREALALRTEEDLDQWAFRHLRAYMLDGVSGPLLASQHGDVLQSLARESLRECLRESAGMEPPVQRIGHLFFTQRSRRETALSLVKFGSLVETRLPYLDNALVDLLMTVPPELKMAETIQSHILRRRRPEFLDVVNVNTGTRMGASAMAKKVAHFRHRVFAKLGVRGYQPYERLGLWLRRELCPLVQKTLLGDRCLQRGIFHPQTVSRVVEEHSAGRRNHTFLLMAMMIFEFGQRLLVDGESLLGEKEAG